MFFVCEVRSLRVEVRKLGCEVRKKWSEVRKLRNEVLSPLFVHVFFKKNSPFHKKGAKLVRLIDLLFTEFRCHFIDNRYNNQSQ
jgi:hypothetical protein